MTTLREDISNLFYGRKPLHRENPQAGQSEWYYMTPKNPNDLDDGYDYVDVPTQDTPNPLMVQQKKAPISLIPQDETPGQTPPMSVPLLPAIKPAIPYHMSSFNQPTELDAFNNLKPKLKEFEVEVPYPYLDTVGKITYGGGHMDDSLSGFKSQPWIDNTTNQPAEQQEVIKAYNALKDSKFGQKIPAEDFENKTNLRLSEQYMDELFNRDMIDRWNELKSKMEGFSDLDPYVQAAILETHYNANVLPWKNLRTAIRDKNLLNICLELHRKEKGNEKMKERNRWAYEQCMSNNFK